MTDTAIYLREDTIAALSTPVGRGAVAVIRLSGPDAIGIAQRAFKHRGASLKDRPRRMIHGALVDPDTGDSIDRILAVAFPAPRSYTGEDMAEIHGHGSEASVSRILTMLHRQGARPAEPGEFTFRAVRNGKMDLAQAEAVAALIESRSQLARTLSLRMLEGAFSHGLESLKQSITDALVEIETQIEFPGDVAEESLDRHLDRTIAGIVEQTQALQSRAVRERRFDRGIVAVLAGRPNVGKSSLFNRLLGRERAIVTPHPGTTRDSLEGSIELEGWPVTLIDTAGLRETHEEIEAIGVKRSEELLSTSHIVLYVCEAESGLTPEDRQRLDEFSRENNRSRTIVVANKADLVPEKPIPGLEENDSSPWCFTRASAVDKQGLDRLLDVLKNEVKDLTPVDADSSYLITARQEHLLDRIVSQLEPLGNRVVDQLKPPSDRVVNQQKPLSDRVVDQLQPPSELPPLELIAEDMRSALSDIAELDGTQATPDILSAIFSRFCIGK